MIFHISKQLWHMPYLQKTCLNHVNTDVWVYNTKFLSICLKSMLYAVSDYVKEMYFVIMNCKLYRGLSFTTIRYNIQYRILLFTNRYHRDMDSESTCGLCGGQLYEGVCTRSCPHFQHPTSPNDSSNHFQQSQ